jgi:hypothetical protein
VEGLRDLPDFETIEAARFSRRKGGFVAGVLAQDGYEALPDDENELRRARLLEHRFTYLQSQFSLSESSKTARTPCGMQFLARLMS